jgi:hypothetical protein
MEMPPTHGRCQGLLSAYCVGRPRLLASRDERSAQCDHGQTRLQDCRAVTLSTDRPSNVRQRTLSEETDTVQSAGKQGK